MWDLWGSSEWPSTLCMAELHGGVSNLLKLASHWLLPVLSVAKFEHAQGWLPHLNLFKTFNSLLPGALA